MKEMGVKQKLSAGESMRVYYAYEPYVEKGIDILQPSLGRMSRIDDLLKIRDLCRENGLEFQSGGRGAYNAYFGALYGDNERIEFHAPISEPVHELMLNVPTFKDSRFTLRSDIPGMPVRMDLKKVEKLGYLESVAYYQA
jgi:L-alanine-DL-glutamate epimerase-like enolase superfamily enzyme